MPKQSKNSASKDAENKKPKNPRKTDAGGGTSEGGEKKRGCPSEYANKVKPYLADIARYARCGVTEGQLCEYYGVGKTSWAKYKKENPELAETLCKAKQEFKTELINNAYKVAMGYEYTEETTEEVKDKNGAVIGTKTKRYVRFAKPDAGMIHFLLINRFTDDFARDPQIVALRKKALELAEQGKLPPDSTEGI